MLLLVPALTISLASLRCQRPLFWRWFIPKLIAAFLNNKYELVCNPFSGICCIDHFVYFISYQLFCSMLHGQLHCGWVYSDFDIRSRMTGRLVDRIQRKRFFLLWIESSGMRSRESRRCTWKVFNTAAHTHTQRVRCVRTCGQWRIIYNDDRSNERALNHDRIESDAFSIANGKKYILAVRVRAQPYHCGDGHFAFMQ